MQRKKREGFIGVRVTKELIEAIDKIALKNHRTRADELRRMIDDYMGKYKDKDK